MKSQEQAHPSDFTLYGGVSGMRLGKPAHELSHGVVLRSTYAHIMAPYILAFTPAPKGKPHPGPWKAASGGIGFDIEMEIEIPKGDKPTNFTRLNTIWWIVALIRLHQPTGLRVPLVSNQSFSSILKASEEPIFWPIEMAPRQWTFDTIPNPTLEPATLDWLKTYWQSTAKLMDVPSLNAAFQAYDQAVWSYPIGSALLMVWSSIEAMFRPGGRDIARTLSICVASYLEPPGTRRDALFTKVRDLYQKRGLTVHSAASPDDRTAAETFAIGRRCFIRVFEHQVLPNADSLLLNWRAKN